jgi:hypothetical protein
MRATYRIASATALVAVSRLLAVGIAAAQNVREGTVDVMRVVKSAPTRPESSYDVILRGHASYGDLDLSKSADVATLERRLNEEPQLVRERIGKGYPDSRPNTAECAKHVAARAMVQAKDAVAAKIATSAK